MSISNLIILGVGPSSNIEGIILLGLEPAQAAIVAGGNITIQSNTPLLSITSDTGVITIRSDTPKITHD